MGELRSVFPLSTVVLERKTIMWEYSEKVLDHYRHPRNVGKIDDADLIGEAGSLACGDSLKLYIKLDGNVIKDAKCFSYS